MTGDAVIAAFVCYMSGGCGFQVEPTAADGCVGGTGHGDIGCVTREGGEVCLCRACRTRVDVGATSGKLYLACACGGTDHPVGNEYRIDCPG